MVCHKAQEIINSANNMANITVCGAVTAVIAVSAVERPAGSGGH